MRSSLLLLVTLSVLPVNAPAADAPGSPPAANEAQAPADSILGRWKPSDDDVVVAISRNGAGYGGVVAESPSHPKLPGTQMFRGLVYDAARAEWSGEVFAVKKGEFVPAVIRLSKDGFVLTAGSGLFSKKMTWIRA
jgi:uncharacterized protein (DUF2147 family)